MKREELREGLVTRMMDANFKASKTPYTYPPNMCEGMSAALDVAVEELLREPGLGEIQMHDKVNGSPSRLKWSDINWYLAYRRRAQLEKVKTPEERYLVRRIPGCGVGVFDTDDDGSQIGPDFLEGEHAAAFRLGLIAKLKEQA